jgi:hypothetical protein
LNADPNSIDSKCNLVKSGIFSQKGRDPKAPFQKENEPPHAVVSRILGYKFQIRSMQLTTRHPGAMQGSKEVDEHGNNAIRKTSRRFIAV